MNERPIIVGWKQVGVIAATITALMTAHSFYVIPSILHKTQAIVDDRMQDVVTREEMRYITTQLSDVKAELRELRRELKEGR